MSAGTEQRHFPNVVRTRRLARLTLKLSPFNFTP